MNNEGWDRDTPVVDGRLNAPPHQTTLAFREWVRVVYQTVHRFIPDAKASGSTKAVKLSCGALTVRIQPAAEVWWVHFERDGAFAMPPLSVCRHDPLTAQNVAGTIVGFFDATLSTPNKVVKA